MTSYFDESYIFKNSILYIYSRPNIWSCNFYYDLVDFDLVDFEIKENDFDWACKLYKECGQILIDVAYLLLKLFQKS